MNKTTAVKKNIKVISPYVFLVMAVILCSCSLNYGQTEDTASTVPEFIFTNARYKSYQNRKLINQMQAELLEQYKSDRASYAQNAQFFTWNTDGTMDTEGKARLLSVNSKEKIYSMFTDIVLKNYSQNMEIYADSLMFNANTEQLVSGADSSVTIKRKDLELTGKGFSGSGVSSSFSFTGNVKGTINTQEKQKEQQEEQNEE